MPLNIFGTFHSPSGKYKSDAVAAVSESVGRNVLFAEFPLINYSPAIVALSARCIGTRSFYPRCEGLPGFTSLQCFWRGYFCVLEMCCAGELKWLDHLISGIISIFSICLSKFFLLF